MVFGNRRITLHGFRSGCAISLAMSGVDLQTVMDHVGWKTSNTARHHLRMEQVLKSGEAGDSLAELPLDLVELYRKQNELTGFTRAFEMVFSNSLIIHMVINQSECPILVRCMYLDTQ